MENNTQQLNPFEGLKIDPKTLPDQPSQLEDSYRRTLDFEPDTAAQVFSLSKKLNQPPSLIADNLDSAKLAASIPPSQIFKDIEARYPKTSAFLKNNENMAVAKDDIENLGYFESLFRDVSQQFRKGMLMNKIADLSAQQNERSKWMGGRQSKAFENEILAAEKEMGAIPDEVPGGFVHKVVAYGANQLPIMGKVLLQGQKRGAVGLAAGAMFGNPATASAGYGLGVAYGAFEGAAQLEGELAYREYMKIKGVDWATARKYADRIGAVNGLLEASGDLIVAGLAGKAALKLAGSVAARSSSPFIQKVLGKVIASPEVFAKFSVRRAIQEAGKIVMMSELAEVSTELAQNVAPAIGKEYLQALADNRHTVLLNMLPSGAEQMQTAEQTFYATLAFGLLGGGMHVKGYMNEMAESRKAGELYQKTGEAYAKSKLAGRSPEQMQGLAEEVTKGTPAGTVYFPTQAIETYFQSQNQDPVEAMAELGLEKEYTEAFAKDEMVAIPYSTWLAKVQQTPHFAGLSKDFTFEKNGITENERLSSEKAAIAQIEELIRENQKTNPDNKKQTADIEQNLYQGLLNSGTPDGQAKVQSRMVAKMFAVEAAQQNIKVQDLWNRLPVSIENGHLYRRRNLAFPDSGMQVHKDVAAKLGIPESMITTESPVLWTKSGLPIDHEDAASVVQHLTPQRIAAIQKSHGITDKEIMGHAATLKQQAEAERAAVVNETPELMKEILSSKIKLSKGDAYYAELKDLELKWYNVKKIITDREGGKSLDEYAQEFNVTESEILAQIKNYFGHDEKTKRRTSRVGSVESYAAQAKAELVANAFFDDVKKAREGLPAELTAADAIQTQPNMANEPLFQSANMQEIFDVKTTEDGAVLATPKEDIGKNKRVRLLLQGYDQIENNPMEGNDYQSVLVNTKKFVAEWSGNEKPSPAFSGQIVHITEDAIRYAGEKNRTESNQLRRLKQFKNAKTILETTKYVDEMREESDGVKRFGLVGKMSDGTVLRVVVEEKNQGGKRFLSVFDIWGEGRNTTAPSSGRGALATNNIAPKAEIVKAENNTLPQTSGDLFSDNTKQDPIQLYQRILGELIRQGIDKVTAKKLTFERMRQIGQKQTQSDQATGTQGQFAADGVQGFGTGEKGQETLFQDDTAESQKSLSKKDRAFLEFRDKEARLVFLKPDASSFIHEMAHYFLREKFNHVKSGQASAGYMRDYNALAAWLGIKGEQEKVSVEQQEKFARGFELYLRGEDYIVREKGDGWGVYVVGRDEVVREFKTKKEAQRFVGSRVDYVPTFEMKKWFKRYRGWLTRIYKSAAALNVELSDPVREVMTRMLATEAEIDAAQQATGAGVLVDEHADGMDPDLAKELDALREKAHEAAVEKLVRQQMAEITDGHDENVREARRNATKAATAEVSSRPIYRAITSVENYFNHSAAYVAQAFEEKILRGRTKGDVGMLEQVATLNGFSSASALSQTILKTPDMKSEIDSLVEAEMSKMLDLKDTLAIKEAAMEAVLNEHAEELLALEQSLYMDLALKAKGDAQDMQMSTAQRIHNMANVSIDVIRSKVAEIMAERPVYAADDYFHYVTESRNAAVNFSRTVAKAVEIKNRMDKTKDPVELESLKANYAKQLKKAADLKEKQRLNSALAQQAIKNKIIIQRHLRYFHKLAMRGNDLMDMPYGFIRHIDILLARHGLAETKSEDMTALLQIATGMMQSRQSEDDIVNATGLIRENGTWRQETLAEFQERVNDNYYTITIAPTLFGDKPVDYKNISMGDLQNLRDAVTAIYTVGRNHDRFTSDFIKVGIKQAGKECAVSITQNVGRPYAEDFIPFHKPGMTKLKERLLLMWQSPGKAAFENLVNLSTLCRYLDGDKDNGPMFRFVYSILKRSEDNKLKMQSEAIKALNEIIKKHYTEEEFAKLPSDKKYVDAVGRDMTMEEIVVVGLNWGNAGNKARIMDGYRLQEHQGMRIIDEHLTKRDLDYIQDVWDYLDTYWPQIKAFEMKVAGMEPHQVSPVALATRYGNYRGGYYPIAFDPKKSAEAFRNAEQRNALYKQFSAVKAHTDHGHTQSRVMKVDRQVLPEMRVMFAHIEDVIHDLAFREAVIDISRLMRNSDFKMAVQNATGLEGYRSIENTLKAVASDQGEFLTGFDKALRWFRYKVTFATLAYRFKFLLMDVVTNAFIALGEIGPTRLRHAVAEFAMNPTGTKNFVDSKSKRMTLRATMRERDLNDMSRKLGKEVGVFQRNGFILQSLADQALAYPLWMEAYNRALKTNDEATAIDLADDLITRTLGGGSILDQAGFMRGSEFKKMFTMYFSWLSMMFNRWWLQSKSAQLEWNKGNYGPASMLMLKGAFYSWVLPSLVECFYRELVRNAKHDDPEARKKRMLNRALAQPLSYIPLVRDLWGMAIDYAQKQPGTNIRIPLLSAAETVIEAGVDAVKLVTPGVESKDGRKVFDEGVNAASMLSGFPLAANHIIFNFLDWLQDEGELTWKDILSRRTKN